MAVSTSSTTSYSSRSRSPPPSSSYASSSIRRTHRKRHHRDKNILKIQKKSRSSKRPRNDRDSSLSSHDYSNDGYSSSDDDASIRSKRQRNKDHQSKSAEKGQKRSKHEKHKRKDSKNMDDKRSSSPVQLSKFLNPHKVGDVRRSAVSGKKIQMKVEKTKEDLAAENKRSELLKFLNASYD